MGIDGFKDWFVVIACSLFVVVLPLATRAYWWNRNHNREPMVFFGNFFFSNRREHFQRAHVRTGVVIMMLFGVPFFAFGVVVAILDVSVWHVEVGSSNVAGLVALFFIALLAVVTGLYWSIMLYNRPKRLVPPDLRDEPGLIEIMRERRGSREGRSSDQA